MILLTIKTSLSLPVCLASQARAQCMAAWVNIQSTLIVCPVILIKALLSSRLGKRSNMTTFLHIFKLLKIPQHSMYMFPCYGVVRASWVGLVTTLTAYVEGGGATHTMSPHSSDCGQCVKLWSCPSWPPGQKSCSAHARGQRALRATHGWGGGEAEWTVREKGARQSTSWRPEHSRAAASKTWSRSRAPLAPSVQTILDSALCGACCIRLISNNRSWSIFKRAFFAPNYLFMTIIF